MYQCIVFNIRIFYGIIVIYIWANGCLFIKQKGHRECGICFGRLCLVSFCPTIQYCHPILSLSLSLCMNENAYLLIALEFVDDNG